MRVFAALSGVFVGAILTVSGYAMAYLHDDVGYHLPLVLAVAALVGLPVAYWSKATRTLPRGLSRILFAIMIGALVALWWPLATSAALRTDHWAALAIFSIIWAIAALPLLRAGIRHRP